MVFILGFSRKHAAEQHSIPLCLIFHKSLEESFLPKEGGKLPMHVMPIFKKGDRSQPENYRPIILTSVVCKVLQCIGKPYVFSLVCKAATWSPL